MRREELALGYFCNGYQCAQSVILPFKEFFDEDHLILLKASQLFGGGMGLLSICGAVSAALLVMGVTYGKGNNIDPMDREFIHAMRKEFLQKFKDINEGHDCLFIKSKNFQGERNACNLAVSSAVTILDEIITKYPDY